MCRRERRAQSLRLHCGAPASRPLCPACTPCDPVTLELVPGVSSVWFQGAAARTQGTKPTKSFYYCAKRCFVLVCGVFFVIHDPIVFSATEIASFVELFVKKWFWWVLPWAKILIFVLIYEKVPTSAFHNFHPNANLTCKQPIHALIGLLDVLNF